MAQLVMALVVEGSTDARFLDVIAERTALQILDEHNPSVVEVLPVQRLHPKAETQAQRVLAAARAAYGYHLLLLHADADAPSRDAAWQERIRPGLALVQEALARAEAVCDHLVALIPVHMTEAWMLADSAALLEVIGTDETAVTLGMNIPIGQIEAIADPKARVEEIVAAVRRRISVRRRKYVQMASLYEPLARRIPLDRLALLPSYRAFETELARALSRVGLIPHQ